MGKSLGKSMSVSVGKTKAFSLDKKSQQPLLSRQPQSGQSIKQQEQQMTWWKIRLLRKVQTLLKKYLRRSKKIQQATTIPKETYLPPEKQHIILHLRLL